MAIEMQSVSSTRTELRAPTLPTAEGVLNAELQQELKAILGEKVTAQEMLAFMAQQSSRLSLLELKQQVYSTTADLPPPPESMFKETKVMELSSAEQGALDDLTKELMGQAAQGDGVKDFAKTADGILDQLRKKYGDAQVSGDYGPDIFNAAMFGQMSAEAEKIDREWQDLINKLLRSKSADAISVFVAIGHYMTEKLGLGLKDAFKNYHLRQEEHAKKVASLDLEGGVKNPSELLKAQNDQSSFMTESQMGMSMIQALQQDLQKMQNLVKSVISSIDGILRGMIANIRT